MKEGTIKNCHQHTELKKRLKGLLFQGVTSMVGKSIQCDVNVNIVLLFIKHGVTTIETDDI